MMITEEREVKVSDRVKKVLIVDDSETFLMYMSILMRRMGFDKIIPANNGIEALKLLGILMPDVVMLDITMPQMDGITALRHIRGNEHTSNIPVIMITTASDNKTYEECERFGCCGYLTKPVNINKLNDILYECMTYKKRSKRRFLRTSFEKKVAVTHSGVTVERYAVSLSECGIYIREKNPFPVGTEVEIALPLRDEKIYLTGTVIYVKGIHGNISNIVPGMAIEFKKLTSNDSEILRKYIVELLTKDIIEEQDEPFISPDH